MSKCARVFLVSVEHVFWQLVSCEVAGLRALRLDGYGGNLSGSCHHYHISDFLSFGYINGGICTKFNLYMRAKLCDSDVT